MDKMNILITGGNGYIASSINTKLKNKYNIDLVTRDDFNLCNSKEVTGWFYANNKSYDVVIHTAISGGSRLKIDDRSVYENNIAMFDNLVKNIKYFKKLINFGSGAEIFHANTPYSDSKKEIASRIQNINYFYNLRIFGVFDENELPTRFIKSNLIRYINKSPMEIHCNKIMDFIHMDDLTKMVEYYIDNENLNKTVNCSYKQKVTLENIAEYINNLSDHKVPIQINNSTDMQFYCGNSHGLPINTPGVFAGIEKTYSKLKNI